MVHPDETGGSKSPVGLIDSAVPTRADHPEDPCDPRRPDEPRLAIPVPTPAEPEVPRPSGKRDAAEPLAADLRRLHVTVSRRFLEKLEAARDALSHSCPDGSTGEILEAGLDLLLAREAKKRGLIEKPRPQRRASEPDHVPASVKREVWTRDGGRCQWPLATGGICGSTRRLELDHVVPRARGGPSTADNLRVLCRFHSDLAARCVLGDRWMDRFTGRSEGDGGPLAPATAQTQAPAPSA